MNRGVLNGRKQIAIKTIQEKFGIDLSRAVLQKATDESHLQLFQLEKLAAELKVNYALEIDYSEVLEKIGAVPGVGPALFKKISKALKG